MLSANGGLVHFINLSNGVECGEKLRHAPDARVLRIQSTWCEQRRWPDVLASASSELLFRWAQGEQTVIHDVSEKDRITRACWQGLVWIRFCAEHVWSDGLVRTAPRMRNTHNVEGYFLEQFMNLPVRQVKGLDYYRKFWNGEKIRFFVCDGERTHAY